jgi:hypothetical protein
VRETYGEFMRLARMYSYQARRVDTPGFAAGLRDKADEYQRKAAQLDGGKLPDIDE